MVEGETASIQSHDLQLIPAHRTAHFDVHSMIDVQGAELDVSIKTPSGNRLPVDVSSNVSGVFRVEFIPEEIGKKNCLFLKIEAIVCNIDNVIILRVHRKSRNQSRIC